MNEVTGNQESDAFAIQLLATFLLAKNGLSSGARLSEELTQSLPSNLLEYLARLPQIDVNFLQREEELLLIKLALEECYEPRLFNRLIEIDAAYAENYRIQYNRQIQQPEFAAAAVPEPTTARPSFLNLKMPEWKELTSQNEFTPGNLLWSRFTSGPTFDFYSLYNFVRMASAEQLDWMRPVLKYAQIKDNSLISVLLELVAWHQSKFPSLSYDLLPHPKKELNYKQKRALHDLWLKLVQTAESIGGDKLDELALLSRAKNDRRAAPKTRIEEFIHPPTPAKKRNELHFDYRSVFDPGSLAFRVRLLGLFEEIPIKPEEDTKADYFLGWLKDEIEKAKHGDPLYLKQMTELQTEYAEYNATRASTALKTYRCQNLAAVQQFLLAGQEEAAEELTSLGKEILNSANRLPEQVEEQIKLELRRMGGHFHPFTLAQLFILFARKDIDTIVQRNPAFAGREEEARDVLLMVGEYLARDTQEQQRRRALLHLKRVQESTGEQQNSHLQLLATELLAKRNFTINDRPEVLVFEHYANILVRPKQLEALDIFLHDMKVTPNSVLMEMIMGSGKSKVLLPLLALLRANGRDLSMVIVPEPLFENVASDILPILGFAFGSQLCTEYFDRNTTFTSFSLGLIRDNFVDIIEQRKALIISSKSIQCLIIKFIEKSIADKDKNLSEPSEEAQLMQEILALMAKRGSPILDEVDTLLNVLFEVSFSTGNRANPNHNELVLIGEIFDIIYNDDEIKRLMNVESDPQPHVDAPVMSEELFGKCRQQIAKKLIARMTTLTLETDVDTKALHSCLTTAAHQSNLLAFLCRDIQEIDKVQHFFDEQEPIVQDMLALAAEELGNFLPHTLVKKARENYGLANSSLPCPFSYVDKPNLGSQFATPYIIINYTFQYYRKYGIARDLVVKVIEELQSQALEQLREHPGLRLEQTAAWQQFLAMRGEQGRSDEHKLPLFNLTKKQFKLITQETNEDFSRQRAFINTAILPHMELFTHKVSCSSHNLAAFFKRNISGFTGTLWNSKSMHTKFRSIPEAGTTSKTIDLLWRNSQTRILLIKEGNTKKMLEQIDAGRGQTDFRLISDAGGYFKQGDNRSIALTMAEHYAQPVLFYNQQNEQTIISSQGHEQSASESLVAEDERMTFLDQSHTTGADVRQKHDAVGLVSIGRNMLLRDLLQSVWRLRALEKGQKVIFLVNAEAAAIIDLTRPDRESDITFADILRFVIVNQLRQQGKDNFKALRQELANTSQILLLDILLSDFSYEQKKQVLARLQESWLKEALRNPRNLYGKIAREEKIEDILIREKQKATATIRQIFTELAFLEPTFNCDNKIAEIEGVFDAFQGHLPATVRVPLADSENDGTVQTETQAESEQQTESELEVKELVEEQKFELLTKGRSAEYFQPSPLTSECLEEALKNSYQRQSSLFQWSETKEVKEPAFSPFYELADCCRTAANSDVFRGLENQFEGIHLSLWVLEQPAGSLDIETLQLLGDHRTPFHFIFVLPKDEMCVISQYDFDKDLKDLIVRLKDGSRGARVRLKGEDILCPILNLTLDFGPRSEASDELRERALKVRFLDGDSSYTDNELPILHKWIESAGAEKMRALFHRILRGYPQKAADYRANSPLSRLFRKLLG